MGWWTCTNGTPVTETETRKCLQGDAQLRWLKPMTAAATALGHFALCSVSPPLSLKSASATNLGAISIQSPAVFTAVAEPGECFPFFFFFPRPPFLSLFLVTEHSNEKGCGGAVSRPRMWAATSICSRPLRLLTDGPEREVTVLHLQLF